MSTSHSMRTKLWPDNPPTAHALPQTIPKNPQTCKWKPPNLRRILDKNHEHRLCCTSSCQQTTKYFSASPMARSWFGNLHWQYAQLKMTKLKTCQCTQKTSVDGPVQVQNCNKIPDNWHSPASLMAPVWSGHACRILKLQLKYTEPETCKPIPKRKLSTNDPVQARNSNKIHDNWFSLVIYIESRLSDDSTLIWTYVSNSETSIEIHKTWDVHMRSKTT